jgi:predicted nucleotidyltransferase
MRSSEPTESKLSTVPAAVRSALSRYRALLFERFGARVHEFRLFGSFARGEATDESDVDVFVVLDRLTHEERNAAIDLAYHAATSGEWVRVSPLVYTAAEAADLRARERGLLRAIDSEGIAL